MMRFNLMLSSLCKIAAVIKKHAHVVSQSLFPSHLSETSGRGHGLPVASMCLITWSIGMSSSSISAATSFAAVPRVPSVKCQSVSPTLTLFLSVLVTHSSIPMLFRLFVDDIDLRIVVGICAA